MIGIVATTAWRSEQILALRPGETADIAGYTLAFKGVAPHQGPNYAERVGLFEVTRDGSAVTELTPSKRDFSVEQECHHRGRDSCKLARRSLRRARR